MESMYKGIIDHIVSLLKSHFDMCQVYKGKLHQWNDLLRFYNITISLSHLAFGDVFAEIGVREPNPSASEAFSKFGETHRSIEKQSIEMLQNLKPVNCKIECFCLIVIF